MILIRHVSFEIWEIYETIGIIENTIELKWDNIGFLNTALVSSNFSLLALKENEYILCFDWFCFDIWCFNATFSNISAISWRPVLVVEEAGVPGKNHRPWASNWSTLSLAVASRVPPFCNLQNWARTYAVLVIGLYELLIHWATRVLFYVLNETN